MLQPRLIPCLLLRDGGLVKTKQFKHARYIGDPLNAVRIFNEKSVDELLLMDIDATLKNAEPDYKLISDVASECRMPLCYGGGITTLDQIIRIIGLGVEKVALNSILSSNPQLISEAASTLGSQSVVACITTKRSRLTGVVHSYTHSGRIRLPQSPIELATQYQSLGAGEILLNSIDRDGTMKGYDIPFVTSIRQSLRIPVTTLGGAGTLDHISEVFQSLPYIGAAAGSLFVFQGKFKAVLIQYPSPQLKSSLFSYSHSLP